MKVKQIMNKSAMNSYIINREMTIINRNKLITIRILIIKIKSNIKIRSKKNKKICKLKKTYKMKNLITTIIYRAIHPQ